MPAQQNDDKVWWNVERKLEGICKEIAAVRADGRNVLVLAHFEGTVSALEASLRARSIEHQNFSLFDHSAVCATDAIGKVWVGLARGFQAPRNRVSGGSSAGRLEIIVAEHHPLRSRDENLIQAAAMLPCTAQLCFHLSLDDPLLTHFGVENIKQLFKQLGLEEDTCLSNSLINSAIRRAQEKVESQVPKDLPAQSAADWFKYNLPKKE